jgi:hypothetical protein
MVWTTGVFLILFTVGFGSFDFEEVFLVALGFRPNDEVGAFEGFVVAEAEVLPAWNVFSVDAEEACYFHEMEVVVGLGGFLKPLE